MARIVRAGWLARVRENKGDHRDGDDDRQARASHHKRHDSGAMEACHTPQCDQGTKHEMGRGQLRKPCDERNDSKYQRRSCHRIARRIGAELRTAKVRDRHHQRGGKDRQIKSRERPEIVYLINSATVATLTNPIQTPFKLFT